LVVEDEESPNKSSSESLSNKDMLREVARLWSCTSISLSLFPDFFASSGESFWAPFCLSKLLNRWKP
jgi:hypothetical protein